MTTATDSNTTVINLPRPFPKQAEVLNIIRTAQAGQRKIILYGGSAGGGKSFCICLGALDIAFRYPGAHILVGRDEFASLRDTTMAIFRSITNVLPQKGNEDADEIIRWNNNTSTCEIQLDPDEPPAVIYWRQAHDGAAHLSTEYTAIFLDEADRIPRASVSLLIGRLRQKPNGVTPGWTFMVASNPFPGWFEQWWANYETLAARMKKLGIGAVHRIMSRSEDNPYVDSGYKDFMSVFMTEADYQRFGEGSFDFFEGQVFKGFGRATHVMSQEWLRRNIKTFPSRVIEFRDKKYLVPIFVDVIGGLDFASANADAHNSTACVILTFRSQGALRDVVAFEFAERGQGVALRQRQWMRDIERALGRRIRWVADKTQPVGVQLLAEEGFTVVTNSGKHDAWEKAVEYMRDRMAPDDHGITSFFVMDTCPQTIDELRKYRIDPKPKQDGSFSIRPIRVEDDSVDAVRYPMEWRQQQEIQPYTTSPVGYVYDRRKQRGPTNPFGAQYSWRKAAS